MTALTLLGAIAVYALSQSAIAGIAVLAVGAAAVTIQIGIKQSLGIFLLLMPTQYLAIALLQLNGVSQYQQISAIKELIFLAATVWLYHGAEVQYTIADALLVAALGLAAGEQLFHPDLLGMRSDWEWVLLYALGRVLVLDDRIQAIWAKSAVWMCSVLAVAGVWEVEILGSGPRTLLLRAEWGYTKLPASFLATGYNGFRAASTMVSPLAFSGLCMAGLILWWAYMKNPIPGIVIAIGLGFTLTRSAILAAGIGICVLAIRRREFRRLAIYASLAFVGFVILVQSLNLTQFLGTTFTHGADVSTLGHETSIIEGFNIMVEHPLGIGAGTVGPSTLMHNTDALNIENSFLTIGVEYGILGAFLYIAFVAACLNNISKVDNTLGRAAFSILLGFLLLLAVGPIHLDIPLASWIWIPVGMAVTESGRLE